MKQLLVLFLMAFLISACTMPLLPLVVEKKPEVQKTAAKPAQAPQKQEVQKPPPRTAQRQAPAGPETAVSLLAPAEKTTDKALTRKKQPWVGHRTLQRTPTDPLPQALNRAGAVKLSIAQPQALSVVLGRLEATLNTLSGKGPVPREGSVPGPGYRVELEERPPRTKETALALPKPLPLKVKWNGPLEGLLDEITAKTGYRWHYAAAKPALHSGGAQSSGGVLTFYRYHDREYAAATKPALKTRWSVDPKEHATLKKLVGAWAQDSGWSLNWPHDLPDAAIGAKASFNGSFEEAVAALFAATQDTNSLVPWFYHSNRQLVMKADTAAPAGHADRADQTGTE